MAVTQVENICIRSETTLHGVVTGAGRKDVRAMTAVQVLASRSRSSNGLCGESSKAQRGQYGGSVPCRAVGKLKPIDTGETVRKPIRDNDDIVGRARKCDNSIAAVFRDRQREVCSTDSILEQDAISCIRSGIGNQCQSVTSTINICIVPIASQKQITAGIAIKYVITGFRGQPVVAVPATHPLLASVADQDVVARSAVDDISIAAARN